MKISFFGAAGEVTGSCFLVEADGARFLVDCGMFQGGADAYSKNVRALPFDPRSLDFVLLTHAHIDHSGLLPRLVMLGYKKRIYTTPATIDLLEVLLLDSAHIQEKEAEWMLRHKHREGKRWRGANQPLYTVTQAQASLKQFVAAEYDETFEPLPGIRVRLRDAGHILGSAIAEVWVDRGGRSRKLVFSGDLGQPDRPVMRDPTLIDEADILFVESTYGNRLHKTIAETENEIVRAFERTFDEKRGNIVMPAFAVGRTQEIIYILADLVKRGRLRPFTAYVDSPMAYAATRITLEHEEILDSETQNLIDWQQHNPSKLRVNFITDVEESMALNDIREGAVIISASGMCEAGRIKYHLQHNLPRPESSVLITGFQAAGTLGRRLVEGARMVRIFGDPVPVRADVYTIGGLSAHADQAALLGWLRHFKRPPQHTFVVHGERQTAEIFARTIVEQLGWPEVTVPGYRDFVAV